MEGYVSQLTGARSNSEQISASSVTSFADRTLVTLPAVTSDTVTLPDYAADAADAADTATSRQVRVLLWQRLGAAPAVMRQSFSVDGAGGGEQVLRMPPFAPLNSFVHVTVSGLRFYLKENIYVTFRSLLLCCTFYTTVIRRIKYRHWKYGSRHCSAHPQLVHAYM